MNMKSVTKDSWKTLPIPDKRQLLGFEGFYTDADAERMMRGLIPEQMEDKWFIYFQEGWLYFIRSWTGAYIFALKLDGSPAGVHVTESWVNRDASQYKNQDDEYDRKLVGFLVDALLLKKPAQFPRQAHLVQAQLGLVQHHVVGRAYPEAKHQKPGFWSNLFGVFKRKT